MGDNCEHGNDVRYGCKHCDDAGTEPPLARGRMTDLPDAVVDAAVEAFARKRNPKHSTLDHSETLAIRAALAAASGPWAEQLDAATCAECEHPKSDHHWVVGGNRWACRGDCSCDIGYDRPTSDRDAALARNAELNSEFVAAETEIRALRAELDNLRETLAQKIEAEGKKVVRWLADTRSDATDMGRLIGTEDAYKHAAALVRGSDDE